MLDTENVIFFFDSHLNFYTNCMLQNCQKLKEKGPF